MSKEATANELVRLHGDFGEGVQCELAARVEAVLALLDYADGAPVSTGIVATDAVRKVLNGGKP